ncbi:MAG: phosphate signaling complex protein PhoU [Gammaproteobacteria bacterium]|jgi:phosphate transport system protein
MGARGGEHILSRFDDDLDGLRDLTLRMGEAAAALAAKAVDALAGADAGAARQVIHQVKRINELDMEGQEEGVRILATHNPVARDLRLVLCLTRCVSELERVANQAKKVALIAQREVDEPSYAKLDAAIFADVLNLSTVAMDMLAEALRAVRESDVALSVAVVRADERLDQLFEGAMRRLATYLFEDARNIRGVMDAIIALKAMERIGDHAANMAAQLIFAVKGVDVRHIKAETLSEDVLER